MKQITKLKRALSGILSAVMAVSAVPIVSAHADESTEPYPNTLFAASSDEGAITVNAGNFCVNGNIATNGTIVSSGNMNVNGARKENADESMIFIFDKIDNQYFSASNVDEHDEDYTLDELNININVPTTVQGEANLTGNININNALKALEDVKLYGEVKNTNDSVIFSKYGDIIIDSQNVNLNGLVYAPFGSVTINAQNLNLNNVVIIAESIVLTCPNVNANNSSNVSSFVGTASEPLDIPYDEWLYMKDENENDFPDFFENPDNWRLLKDTDGDQLPDCVEQFIGTDATLVDSDGDMLDDYHEVFVTGTDPVLPDTDNNGVSDGDEDFDTDGLTNYQEAVLKTSPWNSDTDGDELTDSDEVDNYGTNPLEPDTDFDGLSDPDEIILGTNPNLADTDGNGTIDGEEHFYQKIEKGIDVDDEKVAAITKVSVSMDCSGLIDDHVSIENVYGSDALSSDVVGIVGAPVDITTDADYNSATITFYYDEALLNGTPEENLSILWYDEANERYVILDEDTVVDAENNTVSYTTTHFSTYLVIDREIWYDCWRENIDYRKDQAVPEKNYDIAFVVDVSGSMAGSRLDDAKTALNTFISAMYPSDNACLIAFNSSGKVISKFGSSTSELKAAVNSLKASGGTSTNSGLEEGLNELIPIVSDSKTPMIVLLCDGDVDWNQKTNDLIAKAKNTRPSIAIYTVNLCDSDSSALEYLSNETGGVPYKATTSSNITEVMTTLQNNMISTIDMTDTDGDGLYDVYETIGMKLQNGHTITTDPNNKDSDNDGISDFDELGGVPQKEIYKFANGDYSCVLFKSISNPLESDSDMDYYPDSEDSNRYKFNMTEVNMNIIDDSDFGKKSVIINPYNKGTYPTTTANQRLVEKTSEAGGITKKIIVPECDGEKAASVYKRDNNHLLKFHFDISGPKSIIIEVTLGDGISADAYTADKKLVKFYEHYLIDFDRCNMVTMKSDNKKLIYTLNVDHKGSYYLEFDRRLFPNTAEITIFEDNIVFVPSGCIASCETKTGDEYAGGTTSIRRIFITDEVFVALLNHYYEGGHKIQFAGLTVDSITDPDPNAVYLFKKNSHNIYVTMLMEQEQIGIRNLDETFSAVGNISTFTGAIVTGLSAFSDPFLLIIGGVSTVTGTYSSVFSIKGDSEKKKLGDAIFNGKMNIVITQRISEQTKTENPTKIKMIVPDYNTKYSTWEHRQYVNRWYVDNHKAYLLDIAPLEFYPIDEENGTVQ